MSNNENNSWSDILKEINITTIPAKYLAGIYATLKNGNVVELVVDPSSEEYINIKELVEDKLEKYDVIRIDFRIDTESLQRDVQTEVDKILNVDKN